MRREGASVRASVCGCDWARGCGAVCQGAAQEHGGAQGVCDERGAEADPGDAGRARLQAPRVHRPGPRPARASMHHARASPARILALAVRFGAPAARGGAVRDEGREWRDEGPRYSRE